MLVPLRGSRDRNIGYHGFLLGRCAGNLVIARFSQLYAVIIHVVLGSCAAGCGDLPGRRLVGVTVVGELKHKVVARMIGCLFLDGRCREKREGSSLL